LTHNRSAARRDMKKKIYPHGGRKGKTTSAWGEKSRKPEFGIQTGEGMVMVSHWEGGGVTVCEEERERAMAAAAGGNWAKG